jgi:hypothetical protein
LGSAPNLHPDFQTNMPVFAAARRRGAFSSRRGREEKTYSYIVSFFDVEITQVIDGQHNGRDWSG